MTIEKFLLFTYCFYCLLVFRYCKNIVSYKNSLIKFLFEKWFCVFIWVFNTIKAQNGQSCFIGCVFIGIAHLIFFLSWQIIIAPIYLIQIIVLFIVKLIKRRKNGKENTF